MGHRATGVESREWLSALSSTDVSSTALVCAVTVCTAEHLSVQCHWNLFAIYKKVHVYKRTRNGKHELVWGNAAKFVYGYNLFTRLHLICTIASLVSCDSSEAEYFFQVVLIVKDLFVLNFFFSFLVCAWGFCANWAPDSWIWAIGPNCPWPDLPRAHSI